MTKKKLIKTKKQPLARHKKVFENLGKGKSLGESMREEGYTGTYANNPQQLTATRSWEELMKTVLSDERLATVHSELLSSARLDHMIFPTGPKTEDERQKYIDFLKMKAKKAKTEYKEIEVITDGDIKELLLSVNCQVRKIVHGEQGRHVYFWSPDNMARDKALDKAYKLKNKYAPEEMNLKFKGFSKEQLIDTILGKITKQKK